MIYFDLLSHNAYSTNIAPTPLEKKMYLVCESALLKFFEKCPCCASSSTICKSVVGTSVRIHQSCICCSYTVTWDSQPHIKDIPLGNLFLSGAIAFSGALPTSALNIFRFMKCATITEWTYFRHQSSLLQPAVSLVWIRHQQELLEDLKMKGEPLILGGDGRADSPGHTAKFGSYTMLDLQQEKVIDIQLVQVSDLRILHRVMYIL